MKLDTIGKNIRKFREIKKLRQEDLAEKTDLNMNPKIIAIIKYSICESKTKNPYLYSSCSSSDMSC